MLSSPSIGLDLALQRWRSQELQQLQVSIHRAFIQIHSLQCPQLPSLRILRDFGDIRRGWDLGPLLQCLREDARRPDPLSGPGNQARRSPRHLSQSHHLPQLRGAHHPSFHQPRGSGVHCSLGPRFRGT